MSTSRFLRAGGACRGSRLQSAHHRACRGRLCRPSRRLLPHVWQRGSEGRHAQGQTITAKALTAHECDSTEWHFVINQVNTEANAPTSITVEWANGASEVVPLAMFTGKVADDVTTSNLDSTVVSATTEIYTGWTAQSG